MVVTGRSTGGLQGAHAAATVAAVALAVQRQQSIAAAELHIQRQRYDDLREQVRA